jgi:hypothetical protein
MASSKDTLRILTEYLRQASTPHVSYSQLLSFCEKWLQNQENDNSDFDSYRRDTHKILSQHLRELEHDGTIEMRRQENHPVTIYFGGYFFGKINEYYELMAEQPDLPFPTESDLNIELTSDSIEPLDVKQDFVKWITDNKDSKEKALRLLFPDAIHSIIATNSSMQKSLLVASTQKLRSYLRNSRNYSYMRQKLVPLFRSRELAVKDQLQLILTSPEGSAKSIMESNDFAFQLWTQLSTNIIKEYAEKADRMIEEHNICQASYLIGYYAVYFKSQETQKKNEETALKTLDKIMHKPPYAFTISEIHNMKDDKGILLTKKYSSNRLNAFLKEKINVDDQQNLPEMLHLSLPNEREYYLYTSMVPKIVFNQQTRAQKTFREYYKNSWHSALLENDELSTMKDPEEFHKHVNNRLRERYPLLWSLLKFELIYLITQETSLEEAARHQMLDLVNTKEQTLKPLPEILQLDQKKILQDAKMLLPAWMSIPILKQIIILFRRLFLGSEFVERMNVDSVDHEGQFSVKKKKVRSQEPNGSSTAITLGEKPESNARRSAESINKYNEANTPGSTSSSGANAKSQKQQFKRAVQNLEGEFVIPGKSLEMSLKALSDKWNPLIEVQAKKNLNEDVNSMCRDFIRGLKISFKKPPPSASAIREMAARLSKNGAFDRIKRKKELTQYIELYFLKVLGRSNN